MLQELRKRMTGRRSKRRQRQQQAKKVKKKVSPVKKEQKVHHVVCGFCNKSDNRCTCGDDNPPRGGIGKHERNRFIRFIHLDERRRYLSDCLDVDLVTNWGRQFIFDGGAVACVILAMFMFRFFNRVMTWRCIVACFRATRKEPDWEVLEMELRDSSYNLHKAFAVPVTARSHDGTYVGNDKVENAVLTFQRVWEHASFQSMCQLLTAGVKTNMEFADLLREWNSCRMEFKGVFGTYRLKNNMDLWLHIGMIWKQAINWWPVALRSGTLEGLERIYGCRVNDESVASKLLAHLYFHLRSIGEFKGKGKPDSVASLSLTLCGWMRSQYMCNYENIYMTGLDRAILQEEQEYLQLRKVLAEEAED